MTSGEFPSDLFINTGDERVPVWEPVRVAFVRWLTKEYHFATPSDTFGERGFDLRVYSDGVYLDGGVAVVHSRVEAAFDDKELTASHAFANEVARSIARRSLKPRKSFNPPGLLNLLNGVLDPQKGILHPHSPDLRFTWRIPYEFVPGATCPGFQKFLAEVLPNERDRREIQKLAGYCLAPGNKYQCAHLFVGTGNNGKSKTITFLTAMLGKENVAAVTLQSLSENKFAVAMLFGKLACCFADLPSVRLLQTSVFKGLTGEDEVQAEQKFRNPFKFENQAKLIFSANTLPEVDDQTKAFWRRWFLIRFEQDFTGREDRTLPDRLFPELPGILNWALAGMSLLEADKGFLTELGADDIKSLWRKRSDSLAWFIAEMVETDPTGWVAKADFYEAYALFCAANKASGRAPDVVGKEIARHMPSIRNEQRRLVPGGPQTRGWLGVRMRPGTEVQGVASPVSVASGTGQTTFSGSVEATEATEAASRTSAQAHANDALTVEEDLLPGPDSGPTEPV